MLPISVIVHPTDFSESSRDAWELACSLARDYGAKLYVIHVERLMPAFAELGAVPPPPIDREGLERQLGLIRPVNGKLEVNRVLLFGDEATEINAFAEKVHADLIVLGTHGRSGLGRLLMGSVAEGVLRRAPCPVLTVKTPAAVKANEPAKAVASA